MPAVQRHASSRVFGLGSTASTNVSIEWDFNGVLFRSTPDPLLRSVRRGYAGRAQDDPIGAASEASCETLRAAGTMPQLAVYRAALATVAVASVARPFIVAVETVPPYNVTVLELTDRALDVGYRTLAAGSSNTRCVGRGGEWPGYVQGRFTFDIAPFRDLDFSGIDDARFSHLRRDDDRQERCPNRSWSSSERVGQGRSSIALRFGLEVPGQASPFRLPRWSGGQYPKMALAMVPVAWRIRTMDEPRNASDEALRREVRRSGTSCDRGHRHLSIRFIRRERSRCVT